MLRLGIRLPLGPPVPVWLQRRWLQVLGPLLIPTKRVRRSKQPLAGVSVERSVGGDAGAVLYVHGGGGILGSPRCFRAATASLAAATRATVFAPDYRKAPEHPCPAAIEDCRACYMALLDEGWSPERIALAGDSIGGGIATALALELADSDLPQPSALILISPHVDQSLSGATITSQQPTDPVLRRGLLDANTRMYCGLRPPHDPRCSPLFADLSGLPPTLIQSGTDDMLFSDSEELAKRARAAGVNVRLEAWGGGLFHAFQWFTPLLPEADRAWAEVGAFLEEHWSAEAALA